MLKEKRGEKKEDKKNIFSLLLFVCAGILIVALINFGSSTHIFNMGNSPFVRTQEDNASSIFNISINNTAASVNGNITYVIITLPSTFTFIANTNYSVSSDNNQGNHTFSNTTTVLTWANTTHFVINGSENSTWFAFNATPSIPGWFNISFATTNGTFTNYSNLTVQVNDTSVPEVQAANFSRSGGLGATIGSNHSGTIYLNVSLWDSGVVNYVLFNVTNSSGGQNGTYVGSNYSFPQNGGVWYNNSLNTAVYADGRYNITVQVNDTGGNSQNGTIYSVTFDNTVPTVTVASSSATQTSLTLTVTASDSTSGVHTVCTSDRAGATFTGTSSEQTLTETGLSCGTTYKYTVTCSDLAGNSASSSESSFATSSCSGGISSTGGASTWVGGTTYLVSEEQFTSGYTKQVEVKDRIKVKIDNDYHHVGLKSLTATTATIEISSDPVDLELDVGEDAKVDLTGDGFYDVYVILNSIIDNKADLTVKNIYEEIPEGQGPVSTTGEEVEIPEQPTDLTWLWITIGVLVVAAIVVGIVFLSKRKR